MIKGIWVHPWDLTRRNITSTIERIKELGFNSISVCARYVEERQNWPGPNILFHNNERLTYLSEESAFYWKVELEKYTSLPEELRPIQTLELGDDILGEYLHTCESYNEMRCVVWLPVLRYERAVRRNSSLGAIDVYGTLADYKRLFLCPSNPQVREFIKIMVEDLVSQYDFHELELDYIRYPKPPASYAPPHVLLPLMPCLCQHCRRDMEKKGIDSEKLTIELKRIGNEIREYYNKHPYFPDGDENYLNALYLDFSWRIMGIPIIRKWLEYRTTRITELVELIRDTVKALNPSIELSADLYPPSSSWIVGQNYRDIGRLIDAVKIMIYTRPFNQSPKRIPFEIQLARRQLPGNTKVIVGLSIWPPTTPKDIENDVKLALEAKPNGLYFYSYGWSPLRNLVFLSQNILSKI